jgi:hypothetical protein
LETIHDLARRLPKLSTNEIWDIVGEPDRGVNQGMGGLMIKARNLGWIKRTTESVKNKPQPWMTGNMSDAHVWESLIYEGDE